MHESEFEDPRGRELATMSAWEDEAAHVAALLERTGIEPSSALWRELLDLVTLRAYDWTDRSDAFGAPLTPRSSALIALRSLAADLLSGDAELEDGDRSVAEVCLNVCAEIEGVSGEAPRQRRWGEGAVPSSPKRPRLLAKPRD